MGTRSRSERVIQWPARALPDLDVSNAKSSLKVSDVVQPVLQLQYQGRAELRFTGFAFAIGSLAGVSPYVELQCPATLEYLVVERVVFTATAAVLIIVGTNRAGQGATPFGSLDADNCHDQTVKRAPTATFATAEDKTIGGVLYEMNVLANTPIELADLEYRLNALRTEADRCAFFAVSATQLGTGRLNVSVQWREPK